MGTECRGGSLDYVTSSGRPLDLFPPLLRHGEKRPFHYWDCHSQFGVTVSMHKASWIYTPHPPHLLLAPPPYTHHAISASPPPLQRIAVVTVWLDHQSWPLTAVFLSTWTGRSQLALSYRCPPDPGLLCVCVCVCSLHTERELNMQSNCFLFLRKDHRAVLFINLLQTPL